jgi:hypothetical protein
MKKYFLLFAFITLITGFRRYDEPEFFRVVGLNASADGYTKFVEGKLGYTKFIVAPTTNVQSYNVTATDLPEGATLAKSTSSQDAPDTWYIYWAPPKGFVTRDIPEANLIAVDFHLTATDEDGTQPIVIRVEVVNGL